MNMDISKLPEEVFVDIVKYLSADDLLACSLVNYSWRNAINNNKIWWRVCKNLSNSRTGEELDHMPVLTADVSEFILGTDEEIAEIERLTTYVSLFNPYSGEDFEPLCKWRKTYMRWVRLNKNWRNQKYKRFLIDDDMPNFTDVDCSDDKLLIVSDRFKQISVWDIKNAPYHLQNIKFSLSHVQSEFVKLCKNYLVIVQCNLLQVYHSTDEGFQLLYRSIFDKDQSYSVELPSDLDITYWYASRIDLYPCDLRLRCVQNGDKFVGTVLDADKKVLHIWDLSKSAEKVEVIIPPLPLPVVDISFSAVGDILFIMLHCGYGKNCTDTVILYDLKQYKFLEFRINLNYCVPSFFFHEKFVLAVDEGRKAFNVWKVNSNFYKKIECDCIIEPKCLNVEGSYVLIFGKQESYRPDGLPNGLVSVYTLSDLKCVFNISVPYIVYFMSLIHSNFLIVNGTNRRGPLLSVIDILKKRILYTIENNDECVFINSIKSKLITRISHADVNLISFW